jgi:hypothetical protein
MQGLQSGFFVSALFRISTQLLGGVSAGFTGSAIGGAMGGNSSSSSRLNG